MSDFVKGKAKMVTVYEKFGIKVHKLRKERKLSQEDLAELIRCDPRTVVAIESGRRNPTLKTIYRIALALKVDLSNLLRL